MRVHRLTTALCFFVFGCAGRPPAWEYAERNSSPTMALKPIAVVQHQMRRLQRAVSTQQYKECIDAMSAIFQARESLKITDEELIRQILLFLTQMDQSDSFKVQQM